MEEVFDSFSCLQDMLWREKASDCEEEEEEEEEEEDYDSEAGR